MQYNFDASQIDPSQLPDAIPEDRYLVTITREEDKKTKPGTAEEGRALVFFLTIQQGPLQGREQRHQMNLMNSNETTVRIANSELSRFAHVTGKVRFSDTRELFNIPFWALIGPQKGDVTYSELKKVWDINGNEPKLNGQSAVSMAPAAPAFAPPAPPALPQWAPPQANPTTAPGPAFAPPAGFPSPSPFPTAAAPATTFPSSPTPAVPGTGWQQGAPVVKAPWAK